MPKVSDEHLAARRQQILDAAAACFARQGFHRTSMSDIVRECGVSAGLVYRYFSSKDEMIEEIVREWHAHRAVALQAGDATESYLGLLRELGTPAGPDPGLALQVWAESVRSPEIRALAREGVDAARRSAAEVVGSDALVRVLIAVYQGLLVQTAWDESLDNGAFVEAVRGVLDRLNPGDSGVFGGP
ncbi:TetR/AcrR family transcriptional regulator [Cryptosporangium phraense]|uniref:TetR/AcrR family transcriptional regulator n=1 Tax=Cryptosporangium phraense TaxID=2593070 RepID=A0A545AF61_9ACTN|nr:TetR/AcrR family transcriptional regulator [Cryptosporangium phraense]TQS39968.1 TetR/AcrR family transcriptional regulator [Cryptosporangium phraense]